MIISDICIKRPVFATVLSLTIILLGIIAYSKLTVREYPKIDEPTVTVETAYLGASSEIVESQITKPLEDSLAGIEGIEVMSSISRDAQSQITLRFKLTRNPEDAANDVRDRVSRVRKLLPKEIDEPLISKVEADAQPIIYIAFSSKKHSAMEISDYADRYVKKRIQSLDGIANVVIFGERRISMRLWLDPSKMASHGLTTQDVENALSRQNIEIPAGRIESVNREFTILSATDLQTSEEFDQIIVKHQGTKLVRFKDIGRAEVYPRDERIVARFNGQEAVALGIIKQATSNPLDVSNEVKKVLPEINQTLPKGMVIDIAYDSSIFIARSIDGVFHTIIEAVILVILVIFFFLRNIKSTMIPLVTIPVSLIGTFMMMYLFNFSINTLTLLAMVLAVGLVVDDAIVMLENIYRHVENGMSAKEAAFKGSKEIAFAVVAMTITLAAVYTPVAFMEGRTGRLFTEFALTLAGSVIISGFVALTLSPMMCSRFLKHEPKHGKLYFYIEHLLESMRRNYETSLTFALSRKITTIIITLITVFIGGSMLFLLKSELTPIEDRGFIIGIAIAPEGSTIEYTSEWMKKLEPVFSSVPEQEKYFTVGGFPVVSQGIAFIKLKDWGARKRGQQEIIAQLQPIMFVGIPGIMAFPVNPPSLGLSAGSKSIEFVIKTSGEYADLNNAVNQLVSASMQFPGLINLDSDLKMNKPKIIVDLNRDKAALIGVNVDDIGRTLETMLGGRQVTRFKKEGQQYDVILQVERKNRSNPNDITDIYVRGDSKKMIKLSNLLTTKETTAPRELNHFNQLRAAKITASLAPGAAMGEALNFLQTKAKEILPNNMQVDYDGQSREFRQSSSSLAITFVLALLFIYLVLSAQFESFINPLIIILTVPLSMAGALLMLYLFGGTLNIYSKIGLITLIGLITKHGILIVEFAGHLRLEGKKPHDAIKGSALLRLRPILMTTGAMVLSALPLALAKGAGAESRHQIGLVIIGGMTIGTFFTLYVVPVVYSLVYREKPEENVDNLPAVIPPN